MIVAISGYAGSGKDTVANIICANDESFKIKKFADKLKKIASILTSIHPDRFEEQEFKHTYMPSEWKQKRLVDGEYKDSNMTVREFLQMLGTEAVRQGLHENTWVNALFSDYKKGDNWVITDCRFPNEFKEVKRRGGVTVYISRPEVRPVNGHSSEVALEGYDFDYVIPNDTTIESLVHHVQDLYNNVIKKRGGQASSL